jgi:hypothetical protein
VQAYDISLSAQEIPERLEELLNAGVYINATSLHQIETIGRLRP